MKAVEWRRYTPEDGASSELCSEARVTSKPPQALALIDKSDVTIVVSELEKIIGTHVSASQSRGYFKDSYEPLGASYHEREDIIFVGGFCHPSNIDAITCFAIIAARCYYAYYRY